MLSAAPLPATKEFTNSLGMRFTRIEAGAFTMGETQEMPPALLDPLTYPTRSELTGRFPEIDPAKFRLPTEAAAHGDYDERPVHRAALSQAYYLGTCEVTNAQFEQFLPAHRALRGKHGFSQADDEAVVFVTWAQAVAFCEWLSQKEQRPYRLPTETEWEYAARAGTNTSRWWGDGIGGGHANCNGCGSQWDNRLLGRVDAFETNAFGLSGMLGNAWEWTADCWHPSYLGAPTDGRAWTDNACTRHAIRGGAWNNIPIFVRSAARAAAAQNGAERDYDYSTLTGFRIARDLP